MNDRRHELQTNELAAYMQKVNKSIEPYSKQIAVVVGLLIVGGIAWGLYSSKASGDRSDATLQLIQAVGSSSAEQLASVSETYPDTAASAWSQLYEGNAHMADGLRALYIDREDAEARLGDARAAFDSALVGSKDPLLQSRAHFGLARVAESLGEIDKAIEEFGKCIEANESEEMAEYAQNRIDTLSNPETRDFIAWFGKQDFRPADPSLPPSLPSGKTLPGLPDLDLPPIGESIGDKLGVSGDDAEGDDGKMKLEEKDGLELPEDSEAGDDKPKTEDKEGLKLPEDAEVKQDADAKASADSTEASDAVKESDAAETTESDPGQPAENSDAENSDAASSDPESSDAEQE